MKRFGTLRSSLVPLAAVLILAACGASQQAGETAPAGNDGGEASDGMSFRVVSLSFDLAELPYLAALDSMRDDGYEIEYVQMTATAEVGIDGVARGLFQFGSDAFPAWVTAIQRGAPLELILQRRFNDWQLYSVRDIATCEDLEGRTVAIHSESSITAAMTRSWVEETCPGTEPNYVIIAGSENRYAAMIAGEVDASPIELVNALQLEEEAGDRFHLLTSFAESLPELAATIQAVNTEFAEQHPETVQALVEAILEQHRLVADDPAYLLELAERYPESVTEQPTEEAAARYAGLFPVNGGLTEETLEYTIDFFTEAGNLEPGLEPAEIADLSYLQEALAEIGER